MVRKLYALPRRRLEQMLKRYERGELAAVDWLDTMALARIRQLRTEVSFRFNFSLRSEPHPLAAHGGDGKPSAQPCVVTLTAGSVQLRRLLAGCGRPLLGPLSSARPAGLQWGCMTGRRYFC